MSVEFNPSYLGKLIIIMHNHRYIIDSVSINLYDICTNITQGSIHVNYLCDFSLSVVQEQLRMIMKTMIMGWRSKNIHILQYIKCYRGERKIDHISSISEIQSQMGYHCIQYTRRHLMSLSSHLQHNLPQSQLIQACYLFLRCSALPAVQSTSRINIMLK